MTGLLETVRKILNDSRDSAEGATLQRFRAMSFESADLRHKAGTAIELFDEQIKKQAEDFFSFSAVYRDGHLDRLVTDVLSIYKILHADTQPFVDEIRWSDDADAVKRMREPISQTYLRMFGVERPQEIVSDDDFWKCLDLKQLLADVAKVPNYQAIPTIFLLEHSFDTLTKLLTLITELKVSLLVMSTQFETVLDEIINKISRNEVIATADKIEFDRPETVILGHVLQAYITNTINQKWYGVSIKTPLGEMAADSELMLKEVVDLCSPHRTTGPKGLDHLYAWVQNNDAVENYRVLQREFINLVEGLADASKRLTILIDRAALIPQRDTDNSYNFAIDDLSAFSSVYSATLYACITAVTTIAKSLENGLENIHVLNSRLTSMKHDIDNYVNARIRK